MPETGPWKGVDELVAAVGGRDEQLSQVIGALGPARVAAVLAAEIQERAEVPRTIENVSVNLAIRHHDSTHRYVVSLTGHGARVSEGEAGDALAEVSYSLLDLTRLVYPHRAGYQSTSRDVRVLRWPWDQRVGGPVSPSRLDELVMRGEADPEQMAAVGQERLARIFRAVQCVIAACSGGSGSLDSLSARYGSDKWGGLHWYTPHYKNHFAPMRYDPVRVLEIGVGGYKYESLGGESLYMWQSFFPRGLIYGMDLYPKPGVRGPRIRTVQGDQSDAAFLRTLGEELGPFDIVIDDGSHINEHIEITFDELYPCVRPGGYYVIEDLHTSYWPEFGGGSPPASSRTAVGLLKDQLDRLHITEYAGDEVEMSQLTHPSDVCVYHDIAFLRKGIAHERGIPEWIKQASTQAGSFGSSSVGGRAPAH